MPAPVVWIFYSGLLPVTAGVSHPTYVLCTRLLTECTVVSYLVRHGGPQTVLLFNVLERCTQVVTVCELFRDL